MYNRLFFSLLAATLLLQGASCYTAGIQTLNSSLLSGLLNLDSYFKLFKIYFVKSSS